jgi:FtsP/CotA-like multicopper oxidase with cupredoxin domain
MANSRFTRRSFVGAVGTLAGGSLLFQNVGCKQPEMSQPNPAAMPAGSAADCTVTIAVKPVELAPNRIVSTTTYNGQFPGPLLRFKEGKPVTIDINNQTDTPEQLHWHGQFLATDVDGAAEEGTPFIPAHGSRRITFVPKPSGYRFYHTHVHAGANLSAGQYTGLVGPVYIEPKNNPGNYDREVFLTLKEFEPAYSRGGDMVMDFLLPATTAQGLKDSGENAMNASLAKGMPHGFEVGYGSFTINGRMLGSGEPIRVKQGERVLFHVLNGSATEIRSLALPGHTFTVVALDGNPIPRPVTVPGLWLGTAERVSAIVEMNHPGIWIMGDMANDDRQHGMGTVVEYAGQKGKAQWVAPKPFHWNYAQFGNPGAAVPEPDQVFEMTFAKQNAAEGGFNRWTINEVAFAEDHMQPMFRVKHGKRYRLRMRNASDDIHPIHLHRHSFELTRVAGQPTSGVIKDVVMVGGYQEVEIDFVADNPGLTLFHCHQQVHMDFGFMALFEYV